MIQPIEIVVDTSKDFWDFVAIFAGVVGLFVAVWALFVTYRQGRESEQAAAEERRQVFELSVLRDLLGIVEKRNYNIGGSSIVKALVAALKYSDLPRIQASIDADNHGRNMEEAVMAKLDADNFPAVDSPERRAELAIAKEIEKSMELLANRSPKRKGLFKRRRAGSHAH